jgi:pre-rRNA-processing protein RIX1
MTHQYQSLVREITTPTLPAFVTSCLDIISSKSSNKVSDTSLTLIEAIFRSFAFLLPHHTSLYRTFVSQIWSATKPYLAPTSSDGLLTSFALTNSARHLIVIIHQTSAKNTGGEAWGKAVRNLVDSIHVTADQVFRAVIEDWESVAGYISGTVDVNREMSGGAKDADDLPLWTGVNDGIERLGGLLGTLEEYFKYDTALPVSIPLGAIVDMFVRMLSVPIPSSSLKPSNRESARLHPAIDRYEREALWAGMPQIYIAAVRLIETIIERLQEGFSPISEGILSQLAWVFPYGNHDPAFRLATYQLTKTSLLVQKVRPNLRASSSSLSVRTLYPIIQACCRDLDPDVGENLFGNNKEASQQNIPASSQNTDSLLQNNFGMEVNTLVKDQNLVVAASQLLPLLLSHVPQQDIDISIRSAIERTAIMSHNREAMLASVVNPFVGKNGSAITSILPHAAREFYPSDVAEVLLRPRMPYIGATHDRMPENSEGLQDLDDDIEIEGNLGDPSVTDIALAGSTVESTRGDHDMEVHQGPLATWPENANPTAKSINAVSESHAIPRSFSTTENPRDNVGPVKFNYASTEERPIHSTGGAGDEIMAEASDDSDDESVHLNMQLDTDSEASESEI